MHRRSGVPALLAGVGLCAVMGWGETRVVGSDLLGPKFAAQLQAAAEEAGVAVSLDLTGTRPGLARLRSGGAEVGLFVLPPGETPPGGEFFSREIGWQAAVVVVPEASPVRQLTLGQLRGVFASGPRETLATWGDLGGVGDWRSRPIAAHALDAGVSLALPLAQRVVFEGAGLKSSVLTAAEAEGLAQRVAVGDNAIGLTHRLPRLGSGLRALALAASVTTPAYGPTAENLHEGRYPLRLPLHLVVRRSAVPELLPLLRVLLSEPGAEALVATDFQPLPVAARNQAIFEFEDMR